MSAASAPTRMSTTCFTWKCRPIARLMPTRRTLWAPIHLARRDSSTLRPIGARRLNRIGATIGSRSELSACRPTFIRGRRHRPRRSLGRLRPRLSRRLTNTPTSASIRNISIRATIIGSRCAAAIFTNTKSWMQVSPIWLAANPTDTLNEAQAYASLAYGNDNRVVLTGQYFNTWGSPDTGLVRRTCQRLQSEQQRLDRRDRLHSVYQQHCAGMAMVQRPRRAAIHLVQRIRRNQRRRQQQQYALPLSVVGNVAGHSGGFAMKATLLGSRRGFAVDRLCCIRRRSRSAATRSSAPSHGRVATPVAAPAAAWGKRI